VISQPRLISTGILAALACASLVVAGPVGAKPLGKPLKGAALDSSTYQATEGSDSSVTLTVLRSTPKGTASVTLSTSDGTAKAGTDYTAVNTTVSFRSGESAKTVSIPILVDSQSGDGNETVNIALSNPKGVSLDTPSSAVLTIHESTQLLTNGGFETGNFTGWTTGTSPTCLTPSGCNNPGAPTMPAPSIDTGTVHSGADSAYIGQPIVCGSDAGGNAFLYRDVAIPTSGSTSLSFWYRGQSNDKFAFDGQQALIQDTSGNLLATVFNQDDQSLTWKQVTFDLTPYAGTTVRLFFRVYGDGDSTPDCTGMNLDDVSVLNG